MPSLAIRAIRTAARTGTDVPSKLILTMLDSLDSVEGSNRDFLIKSLLQDLSVQFVVRRYRASINNRNILEDVCREVKSRLGDEIQENEELVFHLDAAIGLLVLHFAGRREHRPGQDLGVVRAALKNQVLQAIIG